jgi:hypothetical protein
MMGKGEVGLAEQRGAMHTSTLPLRPEGGGHLGTKACVGASSAHLLGETRSQPLLRLLHLRAGWGKG